MSHTHAHHHFGIVRFLEETNGLLASDYGRDDIDDNVEEEVMVVEEEERRVLHRGECSTFSPTTKPWIQRF